MRNYIYAFTLLVITSLYSNAAFAQAKLGCTDNAILVQGAQFKHDFKAQGMEVYKDAMLSMMPKDPSPVAIQLSKGQLYQFIFVGSRAASKIYFELFDGNDKKLAEKVLDDPAHTNSVVYSFIPPKSDVYLVVLSQKIKGKMEVCGSFTVMQKAQQAPEAK